MRLSYWILALLLAGATAEPARSSVAYNVVLDTSSLAAAPDGYSLFFQLNDGSGSNDANNTVTLSNFAFGSGGAMGLPQVSGGASGDFYSTVTLTDSDFFNGFVQQFVPGTVLSYRLDLTTNVDAGGVPDLFAMSILDGNGSEIPTLDPSGTNTLLTVTIDSPLGIQSWTTDPSIATSTGNFITMGAPVVSDAGSVPEPSTFLLLGIGAAGLLGLRRARPGKMAPAVALLALVLSGVVLRAQTCPAGSVTYAYSSKPYNSWFTYDGGNFNQDPNLFKNLTGYICLPVGACTTGMQNVTSKVTSFSFSSAGYTITSNTPNLNQKQFWVRCDSNGTIKYWDMVASAYPFGGSTYSFYISTVGGTPALLLPDGSGYSMLDESQLIYHAPPTENGKGWRGASDGNQGTWIGNADCQQVPTGSVTHQAIGKPSMQPSTRPEAWRWPPAYAAWTISTGSRPL
jgi:hypothetical protein